MKNRVLILFSVLFLTMNFCQATVTVNDTTSYDNLKNHGYSDKMIDTVQISKYGANGEHYVTNDERKYSEASKPVKWVRKFFIYTDPALDNDQPVLHNTKMTPSVNDL